MENEPARAALVTLCSNWESSFGVMLATEASCRKLS